MYSVSTMVSCAICNVSFRGRSRKIPCVCGCDRVVQLGCVPELTKNAASLHKNGETFVFNCSEIAYARNQSSVLSPSANEPDVRDQLISESDVCYQASEVQPVVNEPEFSPSTSDPNTQPPSESIVGRESQSAVPNPYIPMEFDFSYYNSTAFTRSSILLVEDIQQKG